MPPTNHLEPRVTRIEAEVSAIAKDITALSDVVRELAKNTSIQIKELLVAVNAAAAPRPTNWAIFISAVALIMAVGAAVLSPLSARVLILERRVEESHNTLQAHMMLPIHPVAAKELEYIKEKIDHLHPKTP